MDESRINNLSLDRTSSKRDIEQASRTVAAAVERGTKQVIDESKKVVTAVRDGTKRVADAVRATNNVEQTAAPKPASDTLYEGLKSIASSTSRIADQVLAHPNEVKATLESATEVSRQFTDLVDRASRSAENIGEMRQAVAEATQTSQWLDGDLCGGGNQCIPVGNGAFGRNADFS